MRLRVCSPLSTDFTVVVAARADVWRSLSIYYCFIFLVIFQTIDVRPRSGKNARNVKSGLRFCQEERTPLEQHVDGEV